MLAATKCRSLGTFKVHTPFNHYYKPTRQRPKVNHKDTCTSAQHRPLPGLSGVVLPCGGPHRPAGRPLKNRRELQLFLVKPS